MTRNERGKQKKTPPGNSSSSMFPKLQRLSMPERRVRRKERKKNIDLLCKSTKTDELSPFSPACVLRWRPNSGTPRKHIGVWCMQQGLPNAQILAEIVHGKELNIAQGDIFFLYICICVCIYICLYIYICICLYIYIWVWLCICLCICICIHMSVRVGVRAGVLYSPGRRILVLIP